MNLPNVDPVFLSNPNARTFWEFLRKSRTQFRGWSPKFRAAEQNCPRWKNKKEIQNIFFVQVTKSDLANRSRKNTSLWVSPTHLNVSRTVSNTSSPSISPRPTPRDFALNFSQVGTMGMVWWWWVWWIWYECGGYVIRNTARWVWWQWAR